MTDVLTIEQAAARVQVHPRTIRRAIAKHGLRAINVTARTVRILAVDLDDWLDQRASIPPKTSRLPANVAPTPIRPTPMTGETRPRPAGRGVLTVSADMGRSA